MFASVTTDTKPRWGKMNAGQMLQHCAAFHLLCLDEVRVSIAIRGAARLLGPWFLRRLLPKSPKDSPKSLRTLEPLRIEDPVEFETSKGHLLDTIDRIANIEDGHRHPLYGRMRATDVQALARHHMAHHGNQFGLW